MLKKTKIESIAKHKGVIPTMPSEHLLFSVEEGKGKLRTIWYCNSGEGKSPYDGDSKSVLMLEDTPLVQIQSNGCPTCANLLAAGYGMPQDSQSVQDMRNALNSQYTEIEDGLERLYPLLALLPSGIYILTASEYIPTDGEKNFFWNVPDELTVYQATAQYYDSLSYKSLPSFPLFLYPTQGADKYDAKQVDRYRTELREGTPLVPVLAYALEASISILLDGHHRASACALEGVRVPGLTISRPGRCWRDGIENIIWPDESETAVAKILTTKQKQMLNSAAGEQQSGLYPFTENAISFCRPWEAEYSRVACQYPTCYDAGILALYPHLELSAEGIRSFAMDDDYEEVAAAAQLLHYAARQPGADKKSLAMTFIERGYPDIMRKAAFEVLDSIKDDREIDDIMVDILVNGERKDDPIYQIANSHWD